mgnify:FL=1|tara:strand:- start:860 stop:2044 length:1185 start_codon:yes stop_codon:yes gene_type:complete
MIDQFRRKALAILGRFTNGMRYMKIAVVFVIFSFVNVNTERIKYFQPQTIMLEPHSTLEYQVALQDSVSESDLLYKVSSIDGTPIFFYRKVFSPVCFDNKCRPLTVNLYWNITGRYLGFELPDGEFLSKTDHDPFSTEEYEKLNRILANESTPLADIVYNELTVSPNSHGLDNIDAIATATPQNLAPYVIEGAAYTTFKLWHLIHGPTKNEVQDFTINEISPDLVLKILESPVQVDKIWALEHIDGYVDFTPDLEEKVIGMITGDNYVVIEKALSAINKSQLDSYRVQQLLLKALVKENYNVQILVINKIEDCNLLKQSVTMELVENLADLNGQVFKRALAVLEKQQLSSEMYMKIAHLLRSQNYFISKSIANFLKNKDIKNPKINSLLKKYEN